MNNLFKKFLCFFLIIPLAFLCFVGCNDEKDNEPVPVELNISNIDDYITVTKCDNYGYAAFYIYLTIELEIKEGYVPAEDFSVSCNFSGTFSAVLEEDFVTPVNFIDTEFFYVNFNKGESKKTKSISLYDLKYKNYAIDISCLNGSVIEDI